jgi:hypothetical protein
MGRTGVMGKAAQPWVFWEGNLVSPKALFSSPASHLLARGCDRCPASLCARFPLPSCWVLLQSAGRVTPERTTSRVSDW